MKAQPQMPPRGLDDVWEMTTAKIADKFGVAVGSIPNFQEIEPAVFCIFNVELVTEIQPQSFARFS